VPDPLARFVIAQAPVYAAVLGELGVVRKRSHWMWFVFPQIAGLGHSATARFYALANAAEARDYLTHPVLGERLRRCTDLVLAVRDRSAHDIFGSPDDLKFRSSMTLFAHVAPDGKLFAQALDAYFAGEPDHLTLQRLA
jgi:uncharacterized protein (DUF1810 family)